MLQDGSFHLKAKHKRMSSLLDLGCDRKLSGVPGEVVCWFGDDLLIVLQNLAKLFDSLFRELLSHVGCVSSLSCRPDNVCIP